MRGGVRSGGIVSVARNTRRRRPAGWVNLAKIDPSSSNSRFRASRTSTSLQGQIGGTGMDLGRRGFLAALGAMALVGFEESAEARRSRKRSTRRRARGLSGGIGGGRGEASDGNCPCNGGKVCVGPRGGRYCITSSGRKRYGV